jgi:hypothetical protein
MNLLDAWQVLRAEEGCKIMTDAYENLVKYYGENHRRTILAATRLAACNTTLKRSEVGRELWKKVSETSRKEFGAESKEALYAESQIAFTFLQQSRYTDAIEILERIYPIQKRVLTGDDYLITPFNLGLSYTAKGLYEEKKEYLVRGYDFGKQGLEAIEKSGLSNILAGRKGPFYSLVGLLRDQLFYLDTEWEDIADKVRAEKFFEFERYYPFTHETIPRETVKTVRRVESWYLNTPNRRLWWEGYPRERESILRTLRANEPAEVLEQEAGWECLRCHQPIPYPDYLYRCYQSACTPNGRYIVCESCHRKGLSCLDFKHKTVRTKAYTGCIRCNSAIADQYTWRCDTCEDGDRSICMKCYTNGTKKDRRCPNSRKHHMHKRLQRCFRVNEWNAYYLECDTCENDLVLMEPHWHCKICNEGDYDICHECHERGKKCKDETHVLVKKDRYLKAID